MVGLTSTLTRQAPNAVTLRWRRLAQLSPHELDILERLPLAARHHSSHAELRTQGAVHCPLMLLSGWAYSQAMLSDGRRQIVRFLLPGDSIGPLSRPGLPASSTVMALTPGAVAEARPLLGATDEFGAPCSGLSEAITMMSHAEEASLFDEIVRLGRRTAYERLLHLMLDFHTRLQAIDMVDGDSFLLPLTQEVMADALGLSVVHINRTLQQVRRDKLLEMRGGRVVLLRPNLMRAIADWTTPAG